MKKRSSPREPSFAIALALTFLPFSPNLAIEQQAYVKASNTREGALFGTGLAISGDTMVIGAPGEASKGRGVNADQADNTAPQSGAAYVFVRSGGAWVQQAYLKASNSDGGEPIKDGDEILGYSGDNFGFSVAISGDTIVVGAPGEDSNGNQEDNSQRDSGAAYIFVRSGGAWVQQAYLKASNAEGKKSANLLDPDSGDEFGFSVSISGDTIAVGAPNEASNARGVNGNQADNSAEQAGAAYVFVRSGETWTQQAYLKASNADGGQPLGEFAVLGDQFGSSVSLSGDRLVVGAPREESAARGVNGNQADNSLGNGAGAAYVFLRQGGNWVQEAYLKASNTDTDPRNLSALFGASVSMSGDTVVVGAPNENNGGRGVNANQAEKVNFESGAAYVFHRSESGWAQQAYLKASNTRVAAHFGHVSLFGDRLVVGSYGESSGSAGVNGNQEDTSKFSSGAAYLFRRNGVTWTQEAYLKASNPGGERGPLLEEIFGDWFGLSVAVSGDTVVVGAIHESSSATGVNGDQSNNNALYAGAAYVFVERSSPALRPLQAWRQQHFGITENQGDAANGFDFDHDGVPNLLEYGLATNPKDGQAFPLIPSIARLGGDRYLLTSFTHDPARNDVTVRVETASDLAGPWAVVASSVNGAAMSGPGFVSESDLAGGLKRVEVRDIVPSSAAARRFLRIVVAE